MLWRFKINCVSATASKSLGIETRGKSKSNGMCIFCILISRQSSEVLADENLSS